MVATKEFCGPVGASVDLSFCNTRGQRIYAYSVLPRNTADIRAALVFCHGYAEHSVRKMRAFKQLAASGIAGELELGGGPASPNVSNVPSSVLSTVLLPKCHIRC